MTLRDLPRPAALLVLGVYAVGVVALVVGALLPPARHLAWAATCVILAFVVASKRVKIHPSVASISLGFVFVFAALFHCGTFPAMGAAVANTLGSYVLHGRHERRPSLCATVFNAASLALAALAAGTLWDRLLELGARVGVPWHDLWAALAVVLAYHALTIIALGAVSSLSRSQAGVRRWWPELLATVPMYLAGGAIAFALDQAGRRVGPWVFIVGLPFAYIIHRAYKTQAEKASDEVRYLQERAAAGEKLASLYLSVVAALSNAIDMKDHGTRKHVQRVHDLAQAVGERLGLQGDDLEAVRIGAVLHDIGKLAVPDEILRKPARLTDAESRIVQEHAAAGEAILRPLNFGVPVATIVRHHHEKLDGSGYPDGLAGDEITLGARVLAVIDAYDALVSDRPYRRAWTRHLAIAQLRNEMGTSFDPGVVEALAGVLEHGEFDGASGPAEVGQTAALVPHELRAGGPAGDPLWASRMAEEARRTMLRGLVELLWDRGVFLAGVAYGVSRRAAEIDAVAAIGSCARLFDLARVPLDTGPSGQAARRGEVTVGPAGADLEGFQRRLPAELRSAVVTAIPVTGSGGNTLAVVSLYGADPACGVDGRMDPGAEAAVALAGRQLELIRGRDDAARSPVAPATQWAFAGEAVGGQ